MKRHFISLLLAVLPVLVHATVETQVVNGIKYYYDAERMETAVAPYNYSGDIVIPDSVTIDGVTYSVDNIGNYAFRFSDITSITLPNTIVDIGNYAFYCCGITSISIPNSVKTIGDYAFYNCDSLNSVTLGKGVTRIGHYAFFHTGLTDIVVPKSVTFLGLEAFGYYNMETMVVEEGNTMFDSRDSCNAIIRTASNTLVGGCKNTVIPESVTAIDDGAFYVCEALTSITLSDSIEQIGIRSFNGCINLTSIELPKGLKSLGASVFDGCKSLTSLTIPDSVAVIPDMMCNLCEKLETVTLGEGVKSLGRNVFGGCSSLKKIISNAVTPSACDWFTFGTYPQDCILIVPAGSKAAYQNAEGWNMFSQIFESEEEASGISATKSEHQAEANVYGLNGQCLNGQQKGLNIIRMNDGTVRKVMKK